MRRVLKMALAAAAVGLGTATPAWADAPVPTLIAGDPCHDSYVTIGGQSAIACVGYYTTNMLQGNPGDANTDPNVLAALNLLLTGPAGSVQDHSGAYSPPYSPDVSKIIDTVEGLGGTNPFTFQNDTIMSGLTIIGAHFGNSPDSSQNNVTAFWLFNLVGSSDTVTLMFDGVPNGTGDSNAQLFATSGAVPEPATWALMLLGFGGIGMAMRRGRKQNARLMQIA